MLLRISATTFPKIYLCLFFFCADESLPFSSCYLHQQPQNTYTHIHMLISSNGKISHWILLWHYVGKQININCNGDMQLAKIDKHQQRLPCCVGKSEPAQRFKKVFFKSRKESLYRLCTAGLVLQPRFRVPHPPFPSRSSGLHRNMILFPLSYH